MHVMENLRQRIEAGHGDYINELRVCTTVFCGIPSLQVEDAGMITCKGLQQKAALAPRLCCLAAMFFIRPAKEQVLA